MTYPTFREKLENVAGMLCEALVPIKHEYYLGGGERVAVCTLSSMRLLQTIARTKNLMNKILIIGRLLSENKGIDTMIKFTLNHPKLSYIIVCGNDVKGHQSGQALLSLHRNGATREGRIIGAAGPRPFLTCLQADIELFRKQVMICDLLKCEDLETVREKVISFTP
jgi:tetrahydromethanopterin S-methyltransferase subunit A